MGFSISNKQKGTIFAALSGLAWGMIGYFGYNIMENQSINGMLFWRFLVATIVMFIFLMVTNNKRKIDIKAAIYTFLLGAIFYSSSSYFYFWGSEYVGTGLSMVMFFTFPIFVIILAKFVNKTPIKKVYIYASIVMVIGLIVLADPANFKFDPFGIVPCLLSAATYAVYIISSKNLTLRLDPIHSSFLVILGNTFAFLVMIIIQDEVVIPKGEDLFDIIAIGVISTAFPIMLFLESMKYISAVRASILTVLEPVVVTIIGVLFMEEILTDMQVIGIITILSSAILIQIDWSSISLFQRKSIK